MGSPKKLMKIVNYYTCKGIVLEIGSKLVLYFEFLHFDWAVRTLFSVLFAPNSVSPIVEDKCACACCLVNPSYNGSKTD